MEHQPHDMVEQFRTSLLAEGANPYQPFYPKDTFSKELAATIPRKVAQWLQNMEQEPTGEYGNLKWDFDVDGGNLVYGDFENECGLLIELWWTSAIPGQPENVGCSDSRFDNLATNLEFFTALEHAIYAELDKLQAEYARMPKAPSKPLPNVTLSNEQSEPLGDFLTAEERWANHQDRA